MSTEVGHGSLVPNDRTERAIEPLEPLPLPVMLLTIAAGAVAGMMLWTIILVPFARAAFPGIW